MKLKVGCRVKIIPILNESMDNVVPDMEKYAGKVAIIKDIINNSYYTLDIDNEEWKWNEDYVEEVKDFTLADLKPCMVVVRRNGSVCGIFQLKDRLKLQEDLFGANCNTDDYNDDLTSKSDKIFDIMQVYNFSDNLFGISIEQRELLFERIEKSPQQIKLEELETKQREIADEMAKLRKEME